VLITMIIRDQVAKKAVNNGFKMIRHMIHAKTIVANGKIGGVRSSVFSFGAQKYALDNAA
jgi:hypothetical protein